MAVDDYNNFNFLPQLPKDNLDDRTFEDLVAECILRIPRYCPEWTDYNPSDPGITMIELFAWLTDQMLLRFNKIPRRNYITFLEILGIRLQSPTPARTRLTFYLSQSGSYRIPKGTEVGTKRTEAEEAIIFSTDKDFVVAQPSLRHFLTSETAEGTPQLLRDAVSTQWIRQPNGDWSGNEQLLFDEQPQPGNCFYLVCDDQQPLAGNVIAITFKGLAATPTGIDPHQPPRRWEAWNGKEWESVMLAEEDDYTNGFSFQETNNSSDNNLRAADVILHLPEQFPVTNFIGYQGLWLRCVYQQPQESQPGYINTPKITALNIRAIGATISASHSCLIEDELLGTSDGTSGQTFRLQSTPILPRTQDEHILVIPQGGVPQTWQEVNDFAASTPESLHYTLDSLTGTLQFGPLILEANRQVQQTEIRANLSPLPVLGDYQQRRIKSDQGSLEHQYGSIPPRGAEIRMRSYRYGGGSKGNVDKHTLKILKSAVPYVNKVINYQPARGGSDAESLERAVLRVPKILRTRDRAVTKEDFETITQEAAQGAIARCQCLTPDNGTEAGTISILVVPSTDLNPLQRGEGISPNLFEIPTSLREEILAYINERKLLGIQVRLNEPNYVGVAVEVTEIGLEPRYNNPQAYNYLKSRLEIELYYFLNPITGGIDKKGWNFGRPLYISDIVALFQQIPEIRFVGSIFLYEIRQQQGNWVKIDEPVQMIDPGPRGLICSWKNSRLGFGHQINIRQ